MQRCLPLLLCLACAEGSLTLDPTGWDDAGTSGDPNDASLDAFMDASVDASIPTPRCGDGVLELGDDAPLGEACYFPERLPMFRGERSVAADLNGDGRVELVFRDEVGFALYSFTERGEPTVVQRFEGTGYVLFGQDLDGDADVDLLFQGDDRYWLYFNEGGGFVEPTSIAVAGEVTRVDSGDLDQDGRVDLVISHDDLVEVWRRTQVGFEQTESFVGDGMVLQGDADGDGITDILYRTYVQDAGTILFWARGIGGARFEEAGPYVDAEAYAGGDFDGDGSLDLAYQFDGVLRVRLALQDEVSMASTAERVEAVDMEGDGRHEILVDLGQAGSRVLRADSSGIQTLATIVDVSLPARVRFRDLDQDGDPDLVVRNGPFLGVMRQDTPGRFDTAQMLLVLPSSDAPVVGHFDLDPYPDLIVSGSILPNALGAARFHAAILVDYPTLSDMVGGVLADLDADSTLDLLHAGRILRDVGHEAMTEVGFNGDVGRRGTMLAGDANRDGLLDVVVIESQVATVLRHLGGLQFEEPVILDGLTYPVPITDFDQDGHRDLVAGDRLWFGDGSFALQRDPLAPPVLRASQSAVVDLEGDGSHELLAIRSNHLGVYAQSAPGDFVQTTTLAVPSPVSLFVDGDRLYVLGRDASYWIYRIGDGLEVEVEAQPTLAAEGSAIAVADVSGDGRKDLLIASATRFSERPRGVVQVLLQNARGTFALGRSFGSSGVAASLELADIDGDGLLDVGLGSEAYARHPDYQLHLATP